MVVSALLGAPAGAADIPPVDEVVTSSNVKHLANVPKQGPFAGPTAFGTDITFTGKYAISGNYLGFTIYDISKPSAPTIVSMVSCPGSQNDVSVAADGKLLFLSTDSSRSDDSCQSVAKPVSDPTAWEGIKIFDISDKANPRYIKSVKTQCGSHTHTLVPGKHGSVYIYVSSYILPTWLVGTPNAGPNCEAPFDKISIVKVPLRAPTTASVVATPVLFPDGGNPGNPGRPDNPVPGDDTWVPTTGCHDITAYPDKDIAAGACMGDGALFDISNPEKPKVITTIRDTTNFAFWHSATFNQRASKVVFTDELGGGSAATCNPAVGPTKGANAIYDIVGKGKKRKLRFRSYYKIPRENASTENCVAHNGSLIPVKGRDIMVQSWYQGGISVWDFTNSRKPKELGFFERGPLPPGFALGGTWSAYYYNGYIYSSDIQKGLDVVDIRDRRTDGGKRIRLRELNTQTQPNYFARH
ncbi:LVIVD repeat-containing protein [Spirillospora sp. NPDC048911]|uniref:LVIVD repeat-containing protein n=1 Tax=Spirillospora sp. NPDC048911 TaxID=3364527 RepID=UPI00371F3206